MPPTTHDVLIDLLEEFLSTPCISIVSESSAPIEYRTTTLLLHSARSATIPQLVELLLHILLSHPPFDHTSPGILRSQQQQFFAVWTRDHDLAFGKTTAQSSALTAMIGVEVLSSLRPDFQRLGDSGFRFVSELLLSCLQRLSPEGSSRNLNIRGWVDAHGTGITVLSELLHSIPAADWLRLDEQTEYAVPVWRCLQLLSSGASWWSMESAVYRENMQRLARCVFLLPCSASLFKVALRVEMKPPDVHNIVTTLLGPLERRLGIVGSGRINAFTPSPYTFPTLSALDRHDFARDYELANLRVMFVSWIHAEKVHREMEEFKAPWDMQIVLQHTEAYKKLKVNPESAVRVALIYIFNEIQFGCEGFKPSTDLKAIELLKVFIAHSHLQRSTNISPVSSKLSLREELESRPEACVVANAEWVLPWLWRRRATDTNFAMVMTSAWLGSACTGPLSDVHPVFRLIAKHADNAFGVFHDMFKNVFSHEFVANSADPENTLLHLRKLLKIILDATMLIKKDKPALLSQQLCMLIIRCFVESLDQEWITVETWRKACEVLISVTKVTLSDATKLAQVSEGLGPLILIFLREMEAVNTSFGNHNAVNLPAETLKVQLENLTTLVQFSTILAKSHDWICSVFAKSTYLISVVVRYVGTPHTELLLSSSKPELTWLHSASIGALVELLVATGFGANRTPTLSVANILSASKDEIASRENEIGNIIIVFMKRSFEMSYVISGLCGLVPLIKDDWWSKNQFIYLDLWNYLRSVMLQQETHKWCILLPPFTAALSTLLKVNAPIRQALLSSRWNLSLAAKFMKFLLAPDHPLSCPSCATPLARDISALLTLLLAPHPVWQPDLKKNAGLGPRYSFLEYSDFEIRIRQLVEDARIEDADALMAVAECFDEWTRVRVLRKWLERERRSVQRGGEGSMVLGGADGWYKIFRPVEGGGAVLVAV